MRCPGQDTQYWNADAIYEVKCPECGRDVEFFKDDTTRKCDHCGHRFANPKMDFGCAAYCKYAQQCIGSLPPEVVAQQQNLLKDRVAVEMKRYLGRDFKRIGHATRVARYAERIIRAEGGDMAVILAAAYLHDIGIHEAERKYGTTAAHSQEGPPVAAEILERLGAGAELIAEVCDIVGRHHHPGENETINFSILYDADQLVNLEERHKENPVSPEELNRLIETVFLTQGGRAEALQALSGKA